MYYALTKYASTFFENTKNMDFDVICIKEFLQLRNLFNEKKIITYSTIGIFKEEKDFINLVDADIKRIIQKHFPGKKIEKSPAYGDIDISFGISLILGLVLILIILMILVFLIEVSYGNCRQERCI